jgi:hypothetical protein
MFKYSKVVLKLLPSFCLWVVAVAVAVNVAVNIAVAVPAATRSVSVA